MTDVHNEKVSTCELFHEQLFSPQFFRLWRTSADELAFNPAEDDDDFDVSFSAFNTLSYVHVRNVHSYIPIS